MRHTFAQNCSETSYCGALRRIQPSRVCNNNIPAHENTGERSSQYAAENSCRARYGPYTEWMASFDTGEYGIPDAVNAESQHAFS